MDSNLESVLLTNIQSRLPELKSLLEKVEGEWYEEDGFYRMYHFSFKTYYLQNTTESIVKILKDLVPERELNSSFKRIYEDGTKKVWTHESNKNWEKETRPILEAFTHAKFMLRMAIKYGELLSSPPSILPTGWAALLYLYNLR